MNDLLYLLIGPAFVGIFALLYKWTSKEWKSLTTEEIHELWNANVEYAGTVEMFARALEAKLQERNI
jgi:hypothetical protein